MEARFGVKMLICKDCNLRMYFETNSKFTFVKCPNCERFYYFIDKDVFKMLGIEIEAASLSVRITEHLKSHLDYFNKEKISATKELLKKFKTKEEITNDYEWEEFVKMVNS